MGKTKIIAKNQKSRKIKVQTPKILKSQELKKPQNPLKNFIISLKISLLNLILKFLRTLEQPSQSSQKQSKIKTKTSDS